MSKITILFVISIILRILYAADGSLVNANIFAASALVITAIDNQ